LILPGPFAAWVVGMAVLIFSIQFFGSYTWIRAVFRWLALVLLSYIGAALLARPDWQQTLAATFVPHLHFTRQFFAIVVAMIGTAASPYMYVWQAGQQVEEDISMGRRRLSDRRGTTSTVLRATAWDVVTGMIFSVVVMYFILLATATTLYPQYPHGLSSAADAARALRPLAGHAAAALFASGIIAVGILAVPVMSVGAAYMVCDAAGWKSGLTARPREAKAFYAVIALVTLAAVGFNLWGFNPIHALVAAGVVQGFLAPVLLVILLLLTNDPRVMGQWTNSRPLNILGWFSAVVLAAAVLALLFLL
ncbi:MAG: NRAMP family divalent metal transporter, partial [Terriglobales bacterium]